MKKSWYSGRGLKRGLLLSFLATIVWVAGIYAFMQAQATFEPAKSQFEGVPSALSPQACSCETRT
jgi:hypothetical protein